MDPLPPTAGPSLPPDTRVRRSCRHARRAEEEAARLRAELAAVTQHLNHTVSRLAVVEHAADHDVLTGLANRRAFARRGADILARVAADRPAAGLMVDLDWFKEINESFGHGAGDEVLVVVAQRLTAALAGDLVARLGGDEFAALLVGPHPAADWRWLHAAAARLARAVAVPVVVGGHPVTVTASIGLAPVRGPMSLAEVLHRADVALYRAKDGRGTRDRFDPLAGPGPDRAAAPPGRAPVGASVAWYDPRRDSSRHRRRPLLPSRDVDSRPADIWSTSSDLSSAGQMPAPITVRSPGAPGAARARTDR